MQRNEALMLDSAWATGVCVFMCVSERRKNLEIQIPLPVCIMLAYLFFFLS